MLGALLLSLGVILLDTRGFRIYEYVPRIFLTSVSLAREILGALVASLLTITTFTFSTIMAVLTMYASDFSPRVVENFLREKISLKVMGMFIGGFFYAITSLLFMRDALESDLVISASIGVLYAALSVVYFVRFVHKVSTSVQASYVINTLSDEAKGVFKNVMKDHVEDVTLIKNKTFDFEDCEPIQAGASGYIQLISYQMIFKELKKLDAEVVIHVSTGEFVVKGEAIAYHCKKDGVPFKDSKEQEKIEELINKHLVIEDIRSISYDFRYAIQKIEEVCLRALSKSINDPVTAMDCIHRIGYFLARIAALEEGFFVLEEEEHPGKLYYEGPSFKKDAYRFLQSIIHYGVSDLATVLALFEVLKDTAAQATEQNKETLLELGTYIKEKALGHFSHPIDVKTMEEGYEALIKFIQKKDARSTKQ